MQYHPTTKCVKECEAHDVTSGNEMGEDSHAKNASYYRQQKKRPKTTYEESLLEIIIEKVERITARLSPGGTDVIVTVFQ
jgi:hypothetical protein